MSISHSQAAKQAATNAVVDLIDGGSGAGKLKIKDGATVLATLTFGDPAFGNADANGTATANAITADSSADDTGDADGFDVTDSDDNVIFSGSVTATGGGGDITLDNVSIAAGQTVSMTSLTYDSGEA